MRALSSGGSFNHAIAVTGGAPTLTNVSAAGTGGIEAVGLINFGALVSALNSSFSANGAASANLALWSSYGGVNNLSSSALAASGGAVAVGLRVNNGSHTLANSTASGTGAGESYGVYSGYKLNTPSVSVHQSRVTGGTNSVLVLGGAVRLGASQLVGPAAPVSPGTVVCAASYSGAFTVLSAACS